METILIMGASLMEYGYSSHWVSRLADAYARKAFVYNAGLAGYNSDWLHSILISDTLSTRLVPASMQRPLFITLMVGSNDCSHGLQHVPLARYKKNLHDIIDLLCQRFHPRLGVLVLSIPPIDEVRWPIGKMKKTDRTFADSLRYSEAMKEVVQECKQHHVYLVDLFSAIYYHATPEKFGTGTPKYDKHAPWTRLFYDGLHVNEVGGELFFTTLMEQLRRIKKERKDVKFLPEELDYAFPTYTDIMSGKATLESKL